MKRTPGRVRTAAKWVGLSACAGTVLASLISFTGSLAWVSQGRRHALVMAEQNLMLWAYVGEFDRARVDQVDWFSRQRYHGVWWWPCRFPYGRINSAFFHVRVPLWMLLVGFGLPTAVLFWTGRPRRRVGHCDNCGYDLTGNVSGRCPECGTTIRPKPG